MDHFFLPEGIRVNKVERRIQAFRRGGGLNIETVNVEVHT